MPDDVRRKRAEPGRRAPATSRPFTDRPVPIPGSSPRPRGERDRAQAEDERVMAEDFRRHFEAVRADARRAREEAALTREELNAQAKVIHEMRETLDALRADWAKGVSAIDPKTSDADDAA